MAINTQKFLPSSTKTNVGGALVKSSQKVVGAKTEKLVEDIGIIKVTTIQIDSILKGTLAAEKKKLDQQKRLESSKRREKQEEKLETKPQAEKGQIKVPSVPRMGFLDWVKNFIGNIILGYFAVRILKYLPKIVPIIKFLGAATDFVLDTGGKLLDGLVSFVDWGYKAYDATNSFLKNLGGENFSKIFQSFSGALGTLIETSIIAATVVAGQGKDFFDGQSQTKPTPKGGKPKVTTGIGGKPKFKFPKTGPKITYGGGNKTLLSSVRPFLKRIRLPIIGALVDFGLSVALGEDPGRAAFKAIGAGLLGSVGAALGTVVPIAGNIIGGIVGGVLGDVAGAALYDLFFTGKKPQQKNQKIEKKVGGGITRGGKSRSGAKRTISKGKKQKYKRVLAPKKPGKVEIDSPGDSIGGEEKLFGIFPKPKLPDVINPFKVIKNTGEELGKTDYFGPILAISSKITAGQLPTQQDYKNAGVGINLLIAEGIRQNQLKGGLVAAFAEGGLVDPDVLSAAETGGDVSNWVARTFKGEIESNAQKTLRMIRENAEKKSLTKEQKAPSPDEMGEGAGIQVTSDSEDFWLLATAAMFENSDPQGAADVAQVIYNRTQYPAWNAPTIRKAILNPGQFAVVSDHGGVGVWSQIKDKNSAIAFLKTRGKTVEQLERVAAALLDKSKQDNARSFVGPRDSFRTIKFEKENNALSDDTEKARHNHVFGFEPGGAMIGQFKAGKLSAAQVNSNIIGNVNFAAGDGKFIQGNSGRSEGTHFHIGTNKPGDGSGVAAAGFRTIKHFLGKKSVYVGRSGETIPSNATDEQIKGYISRGQAAHRKTELDLQIGGIGAGNKVAFPLGLKNMKYSSSDGYGVSADITGVNAFVGHGRYKSDGSLAPQQKLVLNPGAPDYYAFHGKSFGIVPKNGLTLKLHEGEMFKVIDKDSVNLFGYDLTKDIIDIENKSQLIAKAPSIIQRLKAISGYTDYEQSEPEIVYVPVPVPTPFPIDSGGYGGSGIVMRGSSNEDPFESLYKFG